jgi:NADH-quinone oxidoreductase subunit E
MLSAEAQKKIQEIIARYPVKRSALLPVLFVVQEELGYLPDEALHEVARWLDLTFLDVATTVSFYTMFHRRPIGRYHIQICRNVSCYLCGGEAIREHLEERLGIRCGRDDARWAVHVERSRVHRRVQLGAGHADQLHVLSPSDAGARG